MAHGESNLVVVAALLANGLIAVAKFIAAFFTRSSAMLAEAFHSLADTVNQLFLLIGVKLSTRPADRAHPFGYAKERYFWAFIVAVSIFTMGAAFSIYEGVKKIIHFDDPEHALRHPLWGLGVLGLALGLESVSWIIAVREFFRRKGGRPFGEAIRDARDPIIITVLFEDTAAIFGLITALAGLSLSWATGNMLFDGAASLLVGLVLAGVAYFLARETKDLLLGESVKAGDDLRIQQIIQRNQQVERLLVQRTMHLGPDDVLAVFKIEFINGLSTEDIEAAINEVESDLRQALPYLKRIWIEPGSSE